MSCATNVVNNRPSEIQNLDLLYIPQSAPNDAIPQSIKSEITQPLTKDSKSISLSCYFTLLII